MNLLLAERAEI